LLNYAENKTSIIVQQRNC